jgi:hypothetical protein
VFQVEETVSQMPQGRKKMELKEQEVDQSRCSGVSGVDPTTRWNRNLTQFASAPMTSSWSSSASR